MDEKLIRIQKGYLLIEKAKDRIRLLSESKEILAEKKKLQDMKSLEDQINENTNIIKNRILETESKLQKKEKELTKIIKYLYTTAKKESKAYKDKVVRQKEIEKERKELKKRIMELFMQVDSLKDQMNEFKISYNDMERKFLKKLSYQNSIIVKYEDKITMMEKKIRKIRKNINPDVLTLYDKKRQKNIIVMSEVSEGKCSQCEEELDDEIMQRILSGEIIECPHCEKILYINEETVKKEEN